ncbi:GAF domain-containing sensor histidine kinase [Sphaerothrix gracilis]|uniref:GAF domain-containing sensor histidine kinase n=1 Tax=Sphaerothrix gracilis TaxID=3151835 RepID=UPI0031FCB33B
MIPSSSFDVVADSSSAETVASQPVGATNDAGFDVEKLVGAIALQCLASQSLTDFWQDTAALLQVSLQAERVLVYADDPVQPALAEASRSELPPLQARSLTELGLAKISQTARQQQTSQVLDQNSALSSASQSSVPVSYVMPLQIARRPWGVVVLQFPAQPADSADFLLTLDALSAAISRMLQHWQERQQLQVSNQTLATEVQQRTAQLQTVLDFEATLKRITDRVRDSLDEKQILQNAVKELTEALGTKGSNTALYDLEQGTSTIYYEYTTSLSSSQGRVSQMEAFPEVYHQLLEGQYFQFCSIIPNPVRGRVAMFACPILDDRGVLGDLWLINDKSYGFNEVDIRLVQQVANQCAIAIRQARLYQAAQSQVEELERLNTLKDDFLSTVSHELRTPVTSMRVALQLLGVTLNQEFDLDSELRKSKTEQGRIARYYQILQEECEREISLINDLLDLQRLDVGNHPIHPRPIQLQSWLPRIVSGFQARAKSRQQQLELQIPAALEKVISDEASLERVIAELLNNACKYTPPGGHICLAVKRAKPDQMQFCITNTGIEIPAAEMPRIFDKFYRVPSADPWKQGGTGLGLALVQKLLLHLQGEIQASSGQNQTCFTFDLPIALRNFG